MLLKNSEKLLSGLHTLLARPKENYFQKGFAGHLFKSNNIRLQIQKEAQGSKVLSISAGRILNIKLSFPTLDEQQTIASFLSLIDERIQTQNKIIEQLKTLIKGLSEKLFTQRLRFKDKNGRKFPDWKEKKLEEVAEKRIVKNKSMSVNLVFTNSAVHGIVNQRDFFDKDIANKNNIHSYYVVEKDDFVYNPRISNGAPVGPISRNKIGIGVMSPLYMIFRFEGVNHDFIEFFYSTNVWHEHMGNIANFGARSDRMSFLSNDFFKMLLPLPCLEEQSKIANFLSAIDEKIEAEKEILQQLESQKKYLLQNLFI
jgi:type I restriction enzyme S subunit